ncbi:MAG: rod-binding protein [Acetatifactor sp.]|nr:rod-binding protein [Acetatifactor sp.]
MDINNISSMYQDLYANSAKLNTSKLEQQLGTDYSKATDDELMDACKKFEAYFLEQVFKGMEKTIPYQEETGSNGALLDFYKDRMVQEVAEQSTERNSLGLAQMLYEQMKRNMGMDAGTITDNQQK